MSGGNVIKTRILDRKSGLFVGPHGTGFSAMPGRPSASPWSIMDRTDSEARAKDMGNLNTFKLLGFGRGDDSQNFTTALWGYHDNGPPDFLGEILWTLGGVVAGVDATLLPADMEKLGSEFSEAKDGSNWYGCDGISLPVAGVYNTADVYTFSTSKTAFMNLARVTINLKKTGHTYLGIHMISGTAAAGLIMYQPIN